MVECRQRHYPTSRLFQATGTKKYWPVFSSTFSATQITTHGFINEFYDDEGSWALVLHPDVSLFLHVNCPCMPIRRRPVLL
jgi:hypothetical protein